MEIQLKSLIAATAMSALIATGCSGNKEKSSASTDIKTQDTAVNTDIRGKWNIENIVFNDSVYVRPDEVVPGTSQYITFGDSTYFIQTNCNTFSGLYTFTGDSIVLGDGAMTEMACDNMATEDAIRKILPNISTIDVQNDSVIRLKGTSPAEYILLLKAMGTK